MQALLEGVDRRSGDSETHLRRDGCSYLDAVSCIWLAVLQRCLLFCSEGAQAVSHDARFDLLLIRERKISPKFSCIKFFHIQEVPTQIPGHPGHSLSKTTEKGHLHKVSVRDIPMSGSVMSQEYPAQTLFLCFFPPD